MRVAKFSLPEDARFRQIHEGHGTFLQPGGRKYVPPEAIRGTCIVGEPDDVVAQIQAMEQAGIREVLLLPPADTQREVFRRIRPAGHARFPLSSQCAVDL